MMTLYFTAKIIGWIMSAMLITAGAMLYAVIWLITMIVLAIEWAIRAFITERET